MRKYILFSIIFLLILVPNSMRASDTTGAYFSANIGAVMNFSEYFVESDNQNDRDFYVTEADLDAGYVVKAAVGLRKVFNTSNIKFELEGAHRSLEVGSINLWNGNGSEVLDGQGNVSATSVMANIHLGLPFMSDSFLHMFYFGIGAGGANLSISDIPSDNFYSEKELTDNGWVGAFQLFAGVELIDSPGVGDDGFWSFLIQYSLFSTQDAILYDAGGQKSVADGLVTHELSFGICYNFN